VLGCLGAGSETPPSQLRSLKERFKLPQRGPEAVGFGAFCGVENRQFLSTIHYSAVIVGRDSFWPGWVDIAAGGGNLEQVRLSPPATPHFNHCLLRPCSHQRGRTLSEAAVRPSVRPSVYLSHALTSKMARFRAMVTIKQ